MLSILPVTSKSAWESFLTPYPEKTFLHSWNWGQFNQNSGEQVFYLGVFEENQLVGVALVIKVAARRGTFLFCPHGPLLDWQHPEHFEALVAYLKDLAKKENASFIRLSPLLPATPENLKHFKNAGFRKAPIHMHAETTWTLDLGPSEEELLNNMRKNTRYYVRRGAKDGVTVEMHTDLAAIDQFYAIHEETVKRHGFVPFSLDYLHKQFAAFAPDNQIAIFHAKFEGKTVSSAVIPFYGDSAFYHHGASSDQHSKVPSAYLLQWEIIREAKRRGLRKYNFWGIAPTDDPKHPWHGLSLFKTGFGGYRTDLVPAQDLPLGLAYYKTWIIDRWRHWRRGF